MSNKDKFNAVDYTALEKMSTQELKDLLRKTFDQLALSDEDSNMILAITEVLDIRENNGDLIDVDVDAAWAKFQKEYLPLVDEDASSATNELDVLNEHVSETKTKKSRWTFKRIAGIAAALAIVIFAAGSLIPTANGSNVWSAFVEWTKETFGFNQELHAEHFDCPPQLEKLSKLMNEHKLPFQGLLPTYIPAEYEEVNTMYLPHEEGDMFICQLADKSHYITLQYLGKSDLSSSAEYQKNDTDVEEYTNNGHTFFIAQNEENYSAVWMKENIECSIQNIATYEDLIVILNSIN